MGYPWGPENWPTIERLESCADLLETAFWKEYDRLVKQRESEHAQTRRNRPITINLTVNGDMPIEQIQQITQEAALAALEETDEESYLTDEEQADLLGMAFARALRSVGDLDPDQDMERCMQDLFSVLHFKVISQADSHDNPLEQTQ